MAADSRWVDGPARSRTDWVLDGLAAAPGWGADAGEVLAPRFLEAIPAEKFAERMGAQATRIGPFRLTGLNLDPTGGRATLSCADERIRVLHCGIEPEPPYRITSVWLADWVPEWVAPPLPQDFAGHDLPRTDPPQRLIVVAGVPGTGKSSLADAVGSRLGIPVFAVDWILGALTPFGGRHLEDLFGVGYEQLITLAYRQLLLGQSAVLDAPVEEPEVRARLRSLAACAGARFEVVSCICSDPALHRKRLESRGRGIAGWHEGGDWRNVERRIAGLPPWERDVCTVDAVRPFEENLAAVLAWLGSRDRSARA